MDNKIQNQSIERLDISSNAIETLKSHKITIIKQLCGKTKTYLKNLGLTNDDTNKVEIELQLLGLNLKTSY